MFYKAFSVTGVENKTTLDSGLISTVEEPKRIRAVLIDVSSYQDNVVEGWIETNRILEIYDKVLNTSYIHGADLTVTCTTKIVRIPIEENIPPGMIFKIGINCGSIATHLFGAYEYEKVS